MVIVWRRTGTGTTPVRDHGKVQWERGAEMAATVLVVEDERKLRDLVRSYLERAGFTVLSTGSDAEAISMAAAVPDLVVLALGCRMCPVRRLRASCAPPRPCRS